MNKKNIGPRVKWVRCVKAHRFDVLWSSKITSADHLISKEMLSAEESVENLAKLSAAANKKLSEQAYVRREKKETDEGAIGLVLAGLLLWMASHEKMAQSEPCPPQRAEAVLIFMLPPDRVEEVLGDFEEAFTALSKRRGRRLAVVWYWWQVGMLGLRVLTGAFMRGVKVLGSLN